MGRPFTITPHPSVLPCPKCGNATDFKGQSARCAEDCCEVWIECGKCGFDPTAEHTGWRLESVMGGTGEENLRAALGCWNVAINEHHAPQEAAALPE